MWGDKGAGEVERVRRLLRGLVERKGRSVRSLEREAGLGKGALSSVLNGDSTLTLRHLLLTLHVVGEDWGSFFRSAFPETKREVPADVIHLDSNVLRILDEALSAYERRRRGEGG